MIFPPNDEVMTLGRNLDIGNQYNDILHNYFTNLGHRGSLPDQLRKVGPSATSLLEVATIMSDKEGALYDPSNITSLNQLAIGTTPVTAVTQPVGLALDTGFGLALGPNLVTNGTFPTDTTGWTPTGGGVLSVVSGRMRVTNGAVNFGGGSQGFTTVVGKSYKIVIEKTVGTITGTMLIGTSVGAQDILNTDASTAIIVATTTTTYITLICAASTIGLYTDFDNVTCKLIEGNHALQATAAATPTWSNRVNLVTASDVLTAALGWGLTGATSVVGAADPDGGTTAYTLTATGINGTIIRSTNLESSGMVVNTSWYIRRRTGTGAVTAYQDTGTEVAVNGLTTEWQRLTTNSYTASGTNGYVGIKLATSGDAVDIWHPQHEYGTSLTRYQRVTTATDFDTAGFPYYLSFLGIDDSLTSATGGGGSAGFFWCGVIEPTGGAGTLRTLFADNGTNTGYKVQLDAANKLSFSAGNNTAFTTKASTATLTTKSMTTVWDDGTNLNVQINSVAAETVGRPVVVAGTAGFTIGKDNGAASSFAIVNLYPSVYFKNTGLTAAQRASVQAWVRSKAGM